jgi:hypothetical protein
MLANDTNETFGSFTINIYTFVVLTPPFPKKGVLANPGEGASPSLLPPTPRTILTHFSEKFFQKYF